MVALLVRLKLTLLRRGFTRSGKAAFGMVVAYLFALGLSLPPAIGLAFLQAGGPGLVSAVTVPFFAVLTLGWLVLPLLFFGVDETLDPARFALFPVAAGRLVPGLIAASFVGAPGLALLLVSAGLVVAHSSSPSGLVAALLAVPLGALTCVVLSRALTTALAGALGRRRARENVAAIIAFTGMFIGIGMQVIGRLIAGWVDANDDPGAAARGYAEVVGWTPFGWAWAVPGDIGQGRLVVGLIRLVLAAGFAAALVAWWRWALTRALVAPAVGQGDSEKVRSSTTLERLFGMTPRGAIAARIVRSWRRDSRAKVQVASLVVIPVLMIAPTMLATGGGNEREAGLATLLGAGPLVALMAGLVVSNSLVLDGTAASLHALAGVPGRDDRWGRALAYLLLLVPVTIVVFLTGIVVNGRWDLAPPLAGVTVSLLLASVGGASWASASFQWPSPPPGGNPFAQNSGGGAASLILMIANLAAAAAGSLPVIVLMVLALQGHSWAGMAAAVAGPLCGGAMLWLGCRLGGSTLDRRWPEALAAMARA